MCSTSPKTKAASPAVIAPATILKQAPRPPNAFGGFQEHVPDILFTSTSGTPAFLASARHYYAFFGLSPTDIESMEDMVIRLSASSNTNIYKRMLLVSHAHPRGMIIPFFTGGVRGTNKEVFRGFAVSDFDGLQVLNPFNPPVFNWGSVIAGIMSTIRAVATNAVVLAPFGLGSSGIPAGTLSSFFEECFNYVFVKTPGNVKENSGPVTAANRGILAGFVGELINQRAKKIANTTINGNTVTAAQVTALQNMLKALPYSALNAGSVYTMTDFASDNVNYYPTLLNAVRAVHAGFHDKVVLMRKRFTAASFIDIRGCRAGDDADYLKAIREFFDKPDTPGLIASAPRWYQSYPVLAWMLPAGRTEIAAYLAGSIFALAVAHDEQMSGAKAWAKLLKVDPLHLNFWTGVFSGTPAAFLSLSWRGNIPGLFVKTPGLTALASLMLPDLVHRLADMFNVPAAAVPNASQLASSNAPAIQSFMTAALQRLQTGDGIYYYMLFAGLPVFFFNKGNFQNHNGLMVLSAFEREAMQSWYKCLWAEALPVLANPSAIATLAPELSRHAPMLQDDHTATEWDTCPSQEYGSHIQTNP